MRPTLAAPLVLVAFLLTATSVRAGIVCEDPFRPPCFPIGPPEAVLYSVDAGLILLVPSGLDPDFFPFFPPDSSIVDLDDLTHGTSDAYAITQICVADPACREKILGSGPGGRLPLADALVNVYGGSFPDGLDFGIPVPEPGTATLLGLGLGALALAGRRTR